MKNENLENKMEKPSLYDFTRKSVVGAMYRVGASFTMDAIYLSLIAAGTYYVSENMGSLESITKGFSDFAHSLDFGKLMRVAGFVVGINFIDYKFNVTNRLDRMSKKLQDCIISKVKRKKRKN